MKQFVLAAALGLASSLKVKQCLDTCGQPCGVRPLRVVQEGDSIEDTQSNNLEETDTGAKRITNINMDFGSGGGCGGCLDPLCGCCKKAPKPVNVAPLPDPQEKVNNFNTYSFDSGKKWYQIPKDHLVKGFWRNNGEKQSAPYSLFMINNLKISTGPWTSLIAKGTVASQQNVAPQCKANTFICNLFVDYSNDVQHLASYSKAHCCQAKYNDIELVYKDCYDENLQGSPFTTETSAEWATCQKYGYFVTGLNVEDVSDKNELEKNYAKYWTSFRCCSLRRSK